MFPQFTLFGKTIGMYPVMALIGGLLGGFVFCYELRRRGKDDNDGIVFLLFTALGCFVGGAILYSLTLYENYALFLQVTDFSSFIKAFGTVFGGSVFYGGLIGGMLTGLLVIKVKKLDRALYTDLGAILAPLFHSIARIGCFLGGCCYGVESEFGFTAHGNPLVPAVNDVSRFPVQLLESVGTLLICILIYVLYRKGKMKGHLFFLYLGLYAVLRFSDEFLRGDEIRGFVFGNISTSQFISMFMAAISLVGLTLYVVGKRKKQPNGEPLNS
ncbi:MAG: prolipoprotein diacylglyceryl transferase [Clostridia bacterium]|nr:prolipoprotein diacylglyceryl transferase [Clostridia bacterium]